MGHKYSSKKDGLRVRRDACRFAAIVLSTRKDSEPLAPLAFSLAVFFEKYMLDGAAGTVKDFGPKKPVKLKVKGSV